jgi:hypothetical protein
MSLGVRSNHMPDQISVRRHDRSTHLPGGLRIFLPDYVWSRHMLPERTMPTVHRPTIFLPHHV